MLQSLFIVNHVNIIFVHYFYFLQVGGNAFATARSCVDEVCIVSEDDIALAILRLIEIEKSVVEGAGATGLAACLSGQLDSKLTGKKWVFAILSSDPLMLYKCDATLLSDKVTT